MSSQIFLNTQHDYCFPFYFSWSPLIIIYKRKKKGTRENPEMYKNLKYISASMTAKNKVKKQNERKAKKVKGQKDSRKSRVGGKASA